MKYQRLFTDCKTLTASVCEAANVRFDTAAAPLVFAGWLIAMVVWMNAATNFGRFPIIVTLTCVVDLAGVAPILAGRI